MFFFVFFLFPSSLSCVKPTLENGRIEDDWSVRYICDVRGYSLQPLGRASTTSKHDLECLVEVSPFGSGRPYFYGTCVTNVRKRSETFDDELHSRNARRSRSSASSPRFKHHELIDPVSLSFLYLFSGSPLKATMKKAAGMIRRDAEIISFLLHKT